MKRWPAILGVLIGLSILAALVSANNAARIAALIAGAGWGLLLVIALHLPQTLASALGWRALIDDPRRPSLPKLLEQRWIREGVNALLPVAQIGGDLVRARLLTLKGVAAAKAAASCTVDLSMEMASQIAFSLLGVALLLAGPHGAQVAWMLVAGTVGGAAITAFFVFAQRRGAFGAIGETLAGIAERRDWSSLKGISRLHEEIVGLYAQPRRCWTAAGWHLLSWLLGSVETCAGLSVLGLHPTLREAVVIESLGQTARAMGFFIPGALGVQEGGYVLICGLFGVAPQGALALSLIRRIRELALGLPALVVWQRIEERRQARKRAGRIAAVPVKP